MSSFEQTLTSFLQAQSPAYPLDVEAFVGSFGIRVLRVAPGTCPNARLVTNGAGVQILIPREPTDAPRLSARDRFSIAHEFAHYVIWKAHGYTPRGEKDYWVHEMLCDQFAGRLLVPPIVVQDAVKGVGSEIGRWLGIPSKISKDAWVSWQAAAFRVSEETSKVFYFSANKSKNAEGLPVWRVTSSTLRTNERQRVGAYAHVLLSSPEGIWLEGLADSRTRCDVMDFHFPAATIKGAAVVARRGGNDVRFCTVAGFVESRLPAANASRAATK